MKEPSKSIELTARRLRKRSVYEIAQSLEEAKQLETKGYGYETGQSAETALSSCKISSLKRRLNVFEVEDTSSDGFVEVTRREDQKTTHPHAIQFHLFYRVYALDNKHIQYLRAIESHPDMRPVDRDELLGFDRIGGEQILIRKRLGRGGSGILGLDLVREVLVQGDENKNAHTKLVLTDEGHHMLSQEKL